MITFIPQDPIAENDYDIIFNDLAEIRSHIQLLCENSIGIDSFVLNQRTDQNFTKENLFTFFLQSQEDFFYSDIFNPLDIGTQIVHDLRDAEYHRANDEPVQFEGFFQFIYEYMEIRYVFFAPLLGVDIITLNLQPAPVQAIKFGYPARIKKYDKRLDYRLKMRPEHPIIFYLPGLYETPLINFSSGGMAIPNILIQAYQIGDTIDFFLTLPKMSERILFRGEVRHLSAIRLGLKFIPFKNSKGEITVHKRKILLIQQFIEEESNRQKSLKLRHLPIMKPNQPIPGILTPESALESARSRATDEKPTLLIIDNEPGILYNFLNLKYQLIKSPYFRVETIHKLNRIHLIILNPDYNSSTTIMSYLKNNPIAVLTPKLVLTQKFTRDNILKLTYDFSFDKILRIPFQASQLMSSIDSLLNTFPLLSTWQLEDYTLKIMKCKFLFVSNLPIITYGLSRLFHQLGFNNTQSVNESSKMMNILSNFKPDILVIDSGLNEINPFRISPILKRNPTYKKIKIILLITQSTTDYLEKIKKYQIDRFIFYPCRGDDFMDLIKSLEFEIS